MAEKTIITAALTGVLATRDQCPAIPYSAAEIAEEARRSVDAGASIVHIHARQPNGLPAYDVESYRQIDLALRERCPDVIVNYSTGVKRGDLVRLSGPVVGRPLLAALYKAVIRAGGNPFLSISLDECQEIKLVEASDEQLRFAKRR